MKNSQQPVTSTVSKVEEFLRFKQLQSQTSLASTLRTAHEERDSKHQLQDELQRLKHKTEAKQTELEQYKKSYEKLSLQVRDAISQLKTEQDDIESQLARLQKQRLLQEGEAAGNAPNKRLSDLLLQLEICRGDKLQRVQRYQEDIKSMDRLIEEENKQFASIAGKVAKNEEWLLGLQRKHQSATEANNLLTLKSDIETVKASNSLIVKNQASEQKRFKKEAEDIRRSLKDYLQKSEERMKSWIKKCEGVVDGKKEWKDVLPSAYFSPRLHEEHSVAAVEAEYLAELQTIGALYDVESKRELDDFGLLSPHKLKTTPFLVRQSQNFQALPLSQTEQQLRQIDNEARQLLEEISRTDSDIDSFKQQIDKYDRQISSLKQSIQAKKRK